jgi:hypothetical protein
MLSLLTHPPQPAHPYSARLTCAQTASFYRRQTQEFVVSRFSLGEMDGEQPAPMATCVPRDGRKIANAMDAIVHGQ